MLYNNSDVIYFLCPNRQCFISSPGIGLFFLIRHWIFMGIWRLSIGMTESLAERWRDKQLDCVYRSCVFGLDWNITPPSFLPHVQSTVLFMVLFFNSSVLSSLIWHFFILFPSIHDYSSSFFISISLSILFFPILYPPTLSLTECCGASAAGKPPKMLHNNAISLPESLLDQGCLGQATYFAILS